MLGTLLSMVFFLVFLPFILMYYIFKWSIKVVIYLILIFFALGLLLMFL
ncbi:hypothetical protein [uncultured Catenibacterium sp.]|nr:hypothetical protein [uncultured Catenibacterium sp.]